MLHELLLALKGYSGSLFLSTAKDEIQVSTSLTLCHPSEIEALNRICRLGSIYFKLIQFIKTNGHMKSSISLVDADVKGSNKAGNPSLKDGMYIRAFCEGINVVLTPYRQLIIHLESEILNDSFLTLSHIHCRLDKFHIVLPALLCLIEEISAKKVHGCQILDVIHGHCTSGVPWIQTSMKKILHSCHGVLFKQLFSWLLHGILFDPYEEFFVQKIATTVKSKPDAEQNQNGQSASSAAVDDEVATVPQKVTFSLYGKMVPSYISSNLAETILFIGESIQLFEEKGTEVAMLNNSLFVYHGMERNFSDELRSLQVDEELKLCKFEALVDAIRSRVAEDLWKFVVEKSNLYDHLKAMKDFFLLGRGELYLAFLDQVMHILNKVPTISTEQDVNNAFQVAARSVSLEDDPYFEKFRLHIDFRCKKSSYSEFQGSGSEVGWNFIRMSYAVPWPLHILLTPVVLDKYASVFHFLINLRRVQLELQQLWKVQMEARKHVMNDNTSKQYHLRNSMAFLIDNLQYYLQVDVLESQFNILMEKLRSTRDFEKIQMAHHHFLTNVLTQSFILVKPVSVVLREFMKFCLNYCDSLKHTSVLNPNQLHSFNRDFSRIWSTIFYVISKLQSQQSSPYLSQLLLRINFNKYFAF